MFELFCENLEASFAIFCWICAFMVVLFVFQFTYVRHVAIRHELSRDVKQECEKIIDIAATVERQLRDECTRLNKKNVDAKADLEKQKARVQPLQDKHDADLKVIEGLREQLAQSEETEHLWKARYHRIDGQFTNFANHLSAESEELDRTAAELSVVVESGDAALAQVKQLVAKLNSIAITADPSTVSAGEGNGGDDGLEE